MTLNSSYFPQYDMQYSASNAPRFFTLDHLFIVREMTEYSLMVSGPHLAQFEVGQMLAGVLLFVQGDSYLVNGVVQSVEGARAVIRLHQPLDAPLLDREQKATAFASDRRRFFRLHYEPGEGPTIAINAVPYEITELSERGVVFRLSLQSDFFTIGQTVTGLLSLEAMDPVEIAGTVLRIRTAERVVQLSVRSIPPQVMLQEQLRVLRQRHPLI